MWHKLHMFYIIIKKFLGVFFSSALMFVYCTTVYFWIIFLFISSTDPDSMEVEMRDNEPPVNGIPMSAVTSQNTSVSVSSERDHKQQLSVKVGSCSSSSLCCL